MGIFDFLGDLSSKRSKELGLGGLQSLLGTRRAAQAGAIGDEMIGITNKDSLPGYFNEQTREYVPWYVDLFDGGGLNAAGTAAEQEAAQSMAAKAMPGGAPMAQPGLLRPRARQNPLEPFGGAGPTIPEGPLGPFGGAGPAVQSTPDTSYYTPPSSMQMPAQQARARRTGMTGIPGYTLPQNPAARVGTQSIPASGGNMAINTPAAQNRDQMIANQIDLQQLNEMQAHPLYQSFAQSPFGEGDKKYYPVEFFKYLQATGG